MQGVVIFEEKCKKQENRVQIRSFENLKSITFNGADYVRAGAPSPQK